MWLCCCFKNTLNLSVQEVRNLFTSASESPSALGFCLHLLFGSLWPSCVTLYKQKPVSTLPKCVQGSFWNKNDALRKLLRVPLGCHLGFVPYAERPCNWLKVGCWIFLFCFVFEVCPHPPSKKKMPKLPQSQKRGEELCLWKKLEFISKVSSNHDLQSSVWRLIVLICVKWEAVLDVLPRKKLPLEQNTAF